MSATTQAANLAGRSVTLHGDADDPYFGNAAFLRQTIASNDMRSVSVNAVARLDLAKMDMEGFEPAVLAGAMGLIERFGSPIPMEFNTCRLTYVQGFDARTFAEPLGERVRRRLPEPDGVETPAGGCTGLHGRTPPRTSSGSAP